MAAGLNGTHPTGSTVLAGDKERRPIWPDLSVEKVPAKNVPCVNIRACSRSWH